MSSFAFLRPVIAGAITGAALYVTRGVLDQTVTPAGVVRFAMLPPWQALVGFVCLAALVLVGIDHLNAPRGTTTSRRPRLGELVLPLMALAILIVPFLPVVPDRWPVFQALAGPLVAVVWLSVIRRLCHSVHSCSPATLNQTTAPTTRSTRSTRWDCRC
jgi:hypothetical protein